MKRTLFLCCLSALLLFAAGCGREALSKQQAQTLLSQKYPLVVDMLIYAGDPKYATKLQDAGLDADGYVVTKKTKKLGDSTGWVSFTEKAAPYLLPTDAADKKSLVQKVKAGEEKLVEVISVRPGEQGNSAAVVYTTKVVTTPFGKLIKLTDGATKQRTAYFVKSSNDWIYSEKGK